MKVKRRKEEEKIKEKNKRKKLFSLKTEEKSLSVLYSSVHLKAQTYYCSGKNNLRSCGTVAE